MRPIRYFLAFIIFALTNPLSWFLAWDASGGNVLWTLFSVIMPTSGLVLWVLNEVFGRFWMMGAAAWVLGFAGAFVSISLISMLIRDRD